jgi:CDP-diacylglycerol--serine O-phosphatidyltransferase
MLDVADKRWFTGIPSPAAAALVAGLVWIVDDVGRDPVDLKWWAWSVTLFAGLTMVSNVPYYSFKTINLKKSVPFLAIFVFVLVIALLAVAPAIVLFAGFVGYALSGYVAAVWMWYARRKRRLPPASSP